MKRMYWAFILLISLSLGVFLIIGVPENLHMQEVVKANRKILVDVVKCTEVHSGKSHVYTLWFKYENELHNVRIGEWYLNKYRNQEKAELLHLSKYPSLFIQPGYKATNEFIAQIAGIIITLACSIYAALQVFPAKLAFKK